MSSLTRRTVRPLCLILTVSTIGCDQVTKQIAADQLADGARRSHWHDAVRLQYTENPGAFLGLGGLYLILGAGLSNLWDRLLLGRVIDFLNVGIGPLRTGIFNLADVALMVGLALILLGHRRKSSPTPV